MPGRVTVVPKLAEQLVAEGEEPLPPLVLGSLALVDRSESNRNADGSLKNPGFPFWIGGIEDTVGQRAPTPPLDMLNPDKARELRDSGNALWAALDPDQAGGWDGGLPRHSLDGWAAGGQAQVNTSALDMTKFVERARPVYFPEEGTDVEQAGMQFMRRPLVPVLQCPMANFSPAAFSPTAGHGAVHRSSSPG